MKSGKNIISNLSENNLIQKSNPLFSLWKSELTLAEFKILDIYLSRIDSHKPENNTVVFEKGELENLLNVTEIRQESLKERLKHLMGSVVCIDDDRQKEKFKMITLFEMAHCDKDEDDQWTVELKSTKSAMEYIFNIESLGYFRYKLRSIINLTSRHSYVLFLYLENQRHKHLEWQIELTELKKILKCENEESYNEFKIFNNRVLKKCHKEINEKTDLKYDYTPVKRGRSTKYISFTLESLTVIEPEQTTLDELMGGETPVEVKTHSYSNEEIEFIAEACNFEFDEEETQVLFNLTNRVHEIVSSPNNKSMARYHYLAEKYSVLNLQNKKSKINNRFSYMRKLIENDIKE